MVLQVMKWTSITSNMLVSNSNSTTDLTRFYSVSQTDWLGGPAYYSNLEEGILIE